MCLAYLDKSMATVRRCCPLPILEQMLLPGKGDDAL